MTRSRLGRGGAGILLGLASAGASGALEKSPAVFRTEIGMVVLQATVRNEHGELVTNLDRTAFAVYENGEPQAVTAFSREDAPVSLGLVLDRSRSMRYKRGTVQAAALALVRASNPKDEVFLMNFADKASIDVPLTSDILALEHGLGPVECIGGTALRDAILSAEAYLKDHAARERKVLLVVSDGNDNASAASRDQEREQARQTGIVLYAIGLLDGEDPKKSDRGREELSDLAGETGGLVYCPRTLDEVGGIAWDLARQIRSQYTIGYSPVRQALDGSYRKIRLVAKGPARLSVRTRAGYRAVPGGIARSASERDRGQP